MPYTVATDAKISTVAQYLASGTAGNPYTVTMRGTMVFDQILDTSAFDYLEFDTGGARFVSTMAPVVGDADKPSNCLIKSAPTAIVFNSVSTTLSAIAKPGELTLTVVTTKHMAAGDWLQVLGYNAGSKPSNYLVSLEDVFSYRYYKIRSVDSGTQVSIYGNVRYWQAIGATVIKVRVPQGFTWYGGEFDCSGGSIANAFTLDGVHGVEMEGIKLTGFSRAGIELTSGTRGGHLDRIKHGGTINCAIMLKNPEDIMVTNFSSPAWASATKHPNGTPRALINCRSRAQNTIISNARFAWGTLGLRLWGAEGFQADNLHFVDMDGRNITGGVEGRGVAIDMGQVSVTPDLANEVDGALFNNSVQINNVFVGPVYAKTDQCMIWYHDCVGAIMTNVTVAHHGHGDGGTPLGPAVTPIIISDMPGSQLHNVHCIGTYGCIATENGAANNGIISNIYLEASAGSLYSLQPMWYFNHGALGPMTIRDIKISNGANHWAFGTQFNDPYTVIENYQSDGWKQPASRLQCVVTTVARPANEGQIYMLTGALGGTSNLYPLVGAPTAGAVQKCVATVSGSGMIFETGGAAMAVYGYVQELGPGLKSNVRVSNNVGTGPVLLQGDIVRHAAAGDGGVGAARGDNTATYQTALGTVCGTIAGVGATALTRLR